MKRSQGVSTIKGRFGGSYFLQVSLEVPWVKRQAEGAMREKNTKAEWDGKRLGWLETEVHKNPATGTPEGNSDAESR